MNRILMTGDKGFVGSHIRAALEGEHEVVGLEARERFRDWYDDMYDVMDTSTPGAGVGADGVDGGGAAVVGKRTESGVKTRKRESEKARKRELELAYYLYALLKSCQSICNWRRPERRVPVPKSLLP